MTVEYRHRVPRPAASRPPSWTRERRARAAGRHCGGVARSRAAGMRELDEATVIGTTDDRARGWLYFNLVLRRGRDAQRRDRCRAGGLRAYDRESLSGARQAQHRAGLRALRARPAARRRLERERAAPAPVRSLDWRRLDVLLDSHEWGVEKPDRACSACARASAPRRRNGASASLSRGRRRRAPRGLTSAVLFDVADLYLDVDCPRVKSRGRAEAQILLVGGLFFNSPRRSCICPTLVL